VVTGFCGTEGLDEYVYIIEECIIWYTQNYCASHSDQY